MAPACHQTKDEAMCHAQLGRFSKLPTELRHLIWEFVFLGMYSAPQSHTWPPRNMLSILCCSRYLYSEISYHLYHDLSHAILVRSTYDQGCYMTVGIFSSKLRLEWNLKDSAAMRRHLHAFPHTKAYAARLEVEISHANSKDPGRIIYLWKKINDLVETLKALSHAPHVRVRLIGNWLRCGSPRYSIKDTTTYRPDHDIVILPFTGLKRWDYNLPPQLSNTILQEPEKGPHSMLYRLRQNNPRMNNASGDLDIARDAVVINNWLLDTRIFLDTELDDAPGKTSDILRRDRFMNWFLDGNSWKSAYEEQYTQDLISNHRVVLKHDPKLKRAHKRHRQLIYMHDALHAEKDDLEKKHQKFTDERQPSLHTTWNSEAWSIHNPNGIPAFSPSLFSDHTWEIYNVYRRALPLVAQFSEDIYWWASEADEMFAETLSKSYTCLLCSKYGVPCRWCKEYDSCKKCGFCREGFDFLQRLKDEEAGDLYDTDYDTDYE